MCASSSSWEMASARISFSVRLSNERINKLQTGDAPRNRPDFIAPPHRLQAPRSALSLNRKAGQASRLPGSGVAPTWLIPRMYLACTWLAPPNLLPSTWLVPRMYLALSPFLHSAFCIRSGVALNGSRGQQHHQRPRSASQGPGLAGRLPRSLRPRRHIECRASGMLGRGWPVRVIRNGPIPDASASAPGPGVGAERAP
jgi:hypothetical protein